MFTGRGTLLLVSILAASSQTVLGQAPARVSVVHTVSVTVPPRLKVEVAPLAGEVSRNGGLALNVRGTQPWALLVSRRGPSRERMTVRSSAPDETQHESVANAVRAFGSIASGNSSAHVVVLPEEADTAPSDEIVLTVAAR